MIGVVLWSDPQDRNAVFWCEDQGDLAYYTASPDSTDHHGLFNAGDMVEFDVIVERQYRKACNPHLIREKACQGLETHLRSTAQRLSEPPMHRKSGQVVAMNANAMPSRSELALSRNQF